MFLVDRLVLLAALLLLVGIASSRLSSRVGLPVLVLFIAVGMLAGSEGILGIEFENYGLAHAIGTLALAIILFDGGLSTSLRTVRPVLAPSLVLATVGVVITSLLTGLAAHLLLDLPLLPSVLLGSIVGSTDAAAVFATLRSSGLHLPQRLASTLEVESGSNDPMAVFLTIGLLQVLLGEMPLGPGLLMLFVRQMTIGGLIGYVIGRLTVAVVNRINLEAAGLYPPLVAAAGLLAYGLAAALGGSGFLSVYVAGIVIGNRRIVFQRGILLFHDGSAWLAQISMFVILGLLSSPARLLDVAGPGLLIATALIFVARPVTIAVCALPFGFSLRELVFLSFAGLKGAVPIVLGTYPLLLGLANAEAIFDVVFFVVLVSALIQGWSLPTLARRLGLQQPAPRRAAATLEITSLRDVKGDIVEYTVLPGSPIADRTIRELALPDEAVIAAVVRDDRIIPPRGSTRIRADDHVFFVVSPEVRELVESVFIEGRSVSQVLETAEFPLRGSTTLADLREIYDVEVPDEDPDCTLDELIRNRLGERLEVGRGVTFGSIKLRVRELSDGSVESVGLLVLTGEEEEE